jgi:hypothetical protein
MEPDIGTLISICVVAIAALGYVRLLLKRKNRRKRRDEVNQAEQQEQLDRLVDRLRDAFLWDKKSRKIQRPKEVKKQDKNAGNH